MGIVILFASHVRVRRNVKKNGSGVNNKDVIYMLKPTGQFLERKLYK